MFCGQCGAAGSPGKAFCADCGSPLAAVCPACGADVASGKRFCADCGSPLAAVGGPATVAPVAERRVCSVLFVDLVGFTPLSEGRDPEEVRELLSQYFGVARTTVARYGGTVEKFIGDAVMAVWGTPVATDDDAERAVRAGLELVAAVGMLGAEVGAVGLAARAGVVTGEVAVTLGAGGEGMVAGDPVNTAARVQTSAAAHTVLTDESTRRLAQRAIGFDDAGEQVLKGKAEPAHLWRATRVLSGVGGVQRVDGLEAPLIGRDVELRMIKDLFHASVDRRLPRLVVVSGPAGVGKSRLGWEFEKYVDGLAGSVRWHRGRCLTYGDGVAFWALAEIVRQRLGIAEDDPTDIVAARLAAGLAELVEDHDERAYLSVRLGRLLGLPAEAGREPAPALPREELFAAWRMFFERLAGTRPVVLLIEDMHHADSALLDFCDHLVDWTRQLPIFVLAFTRPELAQRRPGFGSGRNRTALTVDPLDPASMDRLLDALVPGMPIAAKDAVTARAEGIPLFAVETIRSLIDDDIVQPRDGVYRLIGQVGELAVPDSLHGLLAARLDSLDPQTRSLVADAAVLGSTFPAHALVAVSGRDEVTVRAAVEELLRRQVLQVSADPLSPERGSYRFIQEMLRQVAYDTLSRRDRKARHLAVAAHLRATFADEGEEVVDIIARHYQDALDAVPDAPDTDRLREEAITAWTRAAGRAGHSGAPRRAATNYVHGARLADEASVHAGATWWEQAAECALLDADWVSAVEFGRLASTGYAAGGHPRRAARAEYWGAEALHLSGRLEDARAVLESALRELRREPGEDTVRHLSLLARIKIDLAHEDGGALSAEALSLGQDLQVSADLMSTLFSIRGIHHEVRGYPLEAAAYYRESARIADLAGLKVRNGIALLNLANVLGMSDPVQAAETAEAAAVILRGVGARDHLSAALVTWSIAQLQLGGWTRAFEALADTEDEGDSVLTYTCALRRWLVGLRGEDPGALRPDPVDASFRTNEDPQLVSYVHLAGAFSASAAGDTALALHSALAALAHLEALPIGAEAQRWAWPLAARTAHDRRDADTIASLLRMIENLPAGQIPPMVRAERSLVRARLAAGTAEGSALFTAAIEQLRAESTPYHLGHGLLDHAEFLTGQGDVGAAAAAVTEAAEIAGRLGCRPLAVRASTMAAPRIRA